MSLNNDNNQSLNSTPTASRTHIGIFGKRNAGKSSLINALTNQNIAIVSDHLGTTTDPVYKVMELLPLGPVVFIDTPGIDDVGELGELRVKRAFSVLNKTDIAVVVVDASSGLSHIETQLIDKIKAKNIQYIVVYNKCEDISLEKRNETLLQHDGNAVFVSAKTSENIDNLKIMLSKLNSDNNCSEKKLVGDIVGAGESAVLVVPIDAGAPKGRLILPQQQTIRDLLENGAMCSVCRDSELPATLQSLKESPKLVITDSQVFGKVNKLTPSNIKLTSFSILFARFKGNLAQTIKGVRALDTIKEGDKILIVEGCTHHRQCDDIGTVKLPKWIREFTKSEPIFEFCSGSDFPENITEYKLIVHCGGCMLNEREIKYRYKTAEDFDIPMTNYGILIAYVHNMLSRSVEIFPEIRDLLD